VVVVVVVVCVVCVGGWGRGEGSDEPLRYTHASAYHIIPRMKVMLPS